jgi:hypothetical protein
MRKIAPKTALLACLLILSVLALQCPSLGLAATYRPDSRFAGKIRSDVSKSARAYDGRSEAFGRTPIRSPLLLGNGHSWGQKAPTGAFILTVNSHRRGALLTIRALADPTGYFTEPKSGFLSGSFAFDTINRDAFFSRQTIPNQEPKS